MSQAVDLTGTQLLTIQYLMDGSNSGVSYDSFHLASVESANFTGDHRADLHDEALVKQASQAGELYHLRFYRNFDNPVGEDYSVQVQVFSDGHIRTTKPVEPVFFDEIILAVKKVIEVRDFLTPLNTLINRYVYKTYRTELPGQINLRIEKTKSAFRNVVMEYFSSEQYASEERDIYESLVANVGIKINQIDNLHSASYPNLGGYDDFPNHERKVQEFFEDYSRTVIGRTGYNFGTLSAHLHNILSRDWDNPTDLIEYVKEKYDLNG